MIFVDENTQKRRFSICVQCPHSRENFELAGITLKEDALQCTKCKCYMKMKTKLKLAKCPINEW